MGFCLAGWAGGCWGGDAMLLSPHAVDEKGLDPMHFALVWAQRRRTQKSYASGVSASVVSVAPEATFTSKLPGYPNALTSADPTANTDFIYLFIWRSLYCVSGPNAAELEAELGCESTTVGLRRPYAHAPVYLHLPTDLITALKEDQGRRNPHEGWQPCIHTVLVFSFCCHRVADQSSLRRKGLFGPP